MATGGLLHHHHHLHPRPPLHLAESHHLLCRSFIMNRPFLRRRYSTTPSKHGLSQATLRSIQCVKREGDGEAMEWVNKAPHDPMVEVDPVTVFRRIVAERRASASANLAMARAKEEEANLALRTTSPPPFILGCKWSGKSAIAIIAALVLLAVAAALYLLRSRKDSADTNDTLKSSINGRRKLVKDTIKAPESVLTAMALGAASVSRPKVHTDSTHDTLHGNVVESQSPEGVTDFNAIANTVAVEDMESDLHGKPIFGQASYGPSIVEDFTPLNVKNVGVDVAEGPWFGQGVNDSEMLAPAEVQELDSEMSLLAESQEPESEKPEELEANDGLIKSQASLISSETIALPATEQFASEISVGDVGFEASVLTDTINGEFHGEVVAVSQQPNHSNVQALQFKSEESQIDGVLAESSLTAEKPELIIQEDSITPLECKGVADGTVCPGQNIVIGSVTLDQDDGVMSLEESDTKSGFEELQVAEGYLLSLSSDSVNTDGGQGNITDLLSGVDQTSEGIETEVDDVLDSVSSSANTFPMGNVEEDEGFVCDPRKEQLTDSSKAVWAFEEDSREDSKKALKAAVPAIAIGVGTVGALFGVAGGLQVVGFAALASFLSHDFLWAQSRESLWQELNGITDRQKLLDFLAKRNIMRTEQEK